MVDEYQQQSPTYVQNISSHHQLAEVDAVQEGTFYMVDGCQGRSMTYMQKVASFLDQPDLLAENIGVHFSYGDLIMEDIISRKDSGGQYGETSLTAPSPPPHHESVLPSPPQQLTSLPLPPPP